jgi:elongation factor 2
MKEERVNIENKISKLKVQVSNQSSRKRLFEDNLRLREYLVQENTHSKSVRMQKAALEEMDWRIKPVLMINKVDRPLLEMMMEPEDMYDIFRKTIESVNVIIVQNVDECMGDLQIDPSTGNVAFGSGLQGWGFTLTRFANM